MDIQITVERLGVIRSALSELHSNIASFVQSAGHSATEGSLAASDLAGFSVPEHVHTVHCLGSLLNEIAADHLTAFLKTISEPAETVAPWNCVRALLESSALASWFFDPKIDVRERVARGFAHRYEGLVQQMRFSAFEKLTQENVKRRIDEVENKAVSLGYNRVQDRNGKRIGIARVMPSATEFIGAMHDEEGFYRLLSAIAHGHGWATQNLSFKLDRSKKVEPAGDGVQLHVIRKALSLNGVAMLGCTSAEAFCRGFWFQCIYFGWSKKQLADIFERSFDRMGMLDRRRFWR